MTDASGESGPRVPQDDSVLDFKRDFTNQVLRPDGKARSYRTIARVTGELEKSTVGNIADLRRTSLPSARHIRAISDRYSPSDTGYWLERRARLEGEIAPPGATEVARAGAAPGPSDSGVSSQGGQVARLRRRRILLLAALATATAFVIGAAFALPVGEEHKPNDDSRASQKFSNPVEDGADPAVSGCTNDAVRVEENRIADVGKVSLVYSAACEAYWARVERTDGAASQNRMVVSIRPPDDRPAVEADEADATVAYTFLLTSTGQRNFCATADIFSGKEVRRGTACY